ncbi:MAG: hypothetical protein H6Q19_1251 [Bacteroidetes bacterium]|nr:hypothetical protein [Bacteroidota bacterium]
MRTRKLFWIFITLFLVACAKNKEKDEVYLELNNKELEREIIKYNNFIDSISDRSYVLNVYCIEKSNSITRYVIGAIDGTDILEMFPYHFICRINNNDVLFTMYSGLVNHDKEKNFFKLKDEEMLRLMRKHFPIEYKTYLQNKEKEKKGETTYKHLGTIFEPEMYYLTFNKEKLIDKVIKRGLPCDFLPIDVTLEKEKANEFAERDSLNRIWLKKIQSK